MSASDGVMCYAARTPGKPGFSGVTVDKPEIPDTAECVFEWLKEGRIVERVTLEVAKAGLAEYFAERGIRQSRH